jgi:hypothetical protein
VGNRDTGLIDHARKLLMTCSIGSAAAGPLHPYTAALRGKSGGIHAHSKGFARFEHQ